MGTREPAIKSAEGVFNMNHLLLGAASGVAANIISAPANILFTKLVSPKQKRKEHSVREGSPHDVGGKKLGERILDPHLSKVEEKNAQRLFTLNYGIAWGMLYSYVRKEFPKSAGALGLPFSIGFFLACDGVLAPLLRLSPPLNRIPWQFNLKELANHIVWTAAAESTLRAAEKLDPQITQLKRSSKIALPASNTNHPNAIFNFLSSILPANRVPITDPTSARPSTVS